MRTSLKDTTIKGVIWSAIERFSVQGIQFILTIIIARLVAPSEYGLIAMLGIFLAIAQTFIDSGFSNALIQKKDRNDIDFSTVFYFNVVTAVTVYLILFICSPFIADFYKEPQLKLVTRYISLNIIISALAIVQRTQLTIKLDFKTQAKASLIAVTISGIAGVIGAYKGLGVWALVIQAIGNNILNTILLWFVFSKWKPLLVFSKKSFKSLFSFGSKLLISGLLHTIYLNLYTLVIGKFFSAAEVGYFNRSYTLAQFPSNNLMGIITRAVYPVQCEIQNDSKRLIDFFYKYLRLSLYIILPLLVGIAALATPLIQVLLTSKWLPSANLLAILALSYAWYPLLMVNGSIVNAIGRSDYVLKAEFKKKILAVIILAITIPFGINIICWGLFIYNFFDFYIMSRYVLRLFKIKFTLQLKKVFPILILNLTMGIVVYPVNFIFHSPILKLIIGTFIGTIYFILISYLFKFQEFNTLIQVVKKNYESTIHIHRK